MVEHIYWENNANNFNAVDISIPAAISVFPGEIYRAPQSWAGRSYHKLIYFHAVGKGGHFAAWGQSELFAAEIRAAFRSLRRSQRGAARMLCAPPSHATRGNFALSLLGGR